MRRCGPASKSRGYTRWPTSLALQISEGLFHDTGRNRSAKNQGVHTRGRRRRRVDRLYCNRLSRTGRSSVGHDRNHADGNVFYLRLHCRHDGGKAEQGKRFEMTDRILVLVRHGESEWNLKNLFTGWRDVDLTENGIKEARAAGRKLKAQGLRFDVGFTSALIRAQRSLDLVLEEMGQNDIPVFKNLALNERDYGELSGLNKDDARKKWGAEQVLLWRRSYDIAPPGGESLRDTAARVLPYYIQEILPRVLRGQRVLVTAHGNSLRALVMVLDRLGPEAIIARELATGVPMIYRLNADATVAERQDVAA